MRILVTGGAGFIGSAVVRLAVSECGHQVVVLDALTYAGHLGRLAAVSAPDAFSFEQVDVCDAPAVRTVLEQHEPDAVLHLAAESHVDRSIDAPNAFIRTNVYGTFTLLEESLRYYQQLPPDRRSRFRFVHVSTDEVFGALHDSGVFTPETPYAPNSPYAATKAASDHLVRSWHATYALPVIVTNCGNNFGPYQFPEKLIPLMILNAIEGRLLPVYGRGENVRDWLHVDDHARALLRVLERGAPGATYLVGGRGERRNIDVVHAICDLVDERCPALTSGPRRGLVHFVTDRPGHDYRYAIDPSYLEQSLGWRATTTFDSGMAHTVDWYIQNRAWCEGVLSGDYRRERLGLSTGR